MQEKYNQSCSFTLLCFGLYSFAATLPSCSWNVLLHVTLPRLPNHTRHFVTKASYGLGTLFSTAMQEVYIYLNLFQNDIPGIAQQKKKLLKARLDMDTCRSR